MSDKLTFSGHDTFHCRLFWLKKGFDHVSQNGKFGDESVVDLGVGRNMVNSIKFWLKSFGIQAQDGQLEDIFVELFQDAGWDPYLEHEATLYLLHYYLCANNYSSIYNIIFRELRKIKPEFTREHFVNYVLDLDQAQNKKILEKDFSVFVRTYNAKEESSKEDSFSGLLTELQLVEEIGKNHKNEKLYRIENKGQDMIPKEIILYCILINSNYGDSISFRNLYQDEKGIGHIFCMDQDKLEQKLVEISEAYEGITYNSEAGVKELQFKVKPEPLNVLRGYYEH